MGYEMRRSDRAMPQNDAKALLQNGECGVLSTVSADGQPYGVPVSYCFTENVIYFHCAIEGHKVENIKKNNKVSFCVVGRTEVLPDKFSTKYESVIVFGKAIEIAGDEKREALLQLINKYSQGFIENGLKYIKEASDKTKVYKILTESITGKARR
jgi:uncharacterized protein